MFRSEDKYTKPLHTEKRKLNLSPVHLLTLEVVVPRHCQTMNIWPTLHWVYLMFRWIMDMGLRWWSC